MTGWQISGEVADSDDEEIPFLTPLADVSPNKRNATHIASQNIAKKHAVSTARYGKENDESQHGQKVSIQRSSLAISSSQPSAEDELDIESIPPASTGKKQRLFSSSQSRTLIDTSPTWRPTSSPRGADLASIESSPLTVLSASPSLLFRAASPSPQFESFPAQHDEDRDEDAELEAAVLAANGISHAEIGGRNLRQRTARQLHPFLVDQARYLKLCRDRGMKPVRFVTPGLRTTIHETRQPEETESPPTSPPVASREFSSPYMSQQSRSSFTGHSDEDLAPRLATTHQREVREARIGCKRRKLDHRGDNITLEDRAAQQPTGHRDVFSISPSASPMSRPIPDIEPDDSDELPLPSLFRLSNRKRATQTLPTPKTSSDPQHVPVTTELARSTAAQPIIIRSSSPQSSDHSSPAVRSRSAASPRAEASNGRGESQSNRLRKVKKRIRGVLPASWLKIDMLAQKPQVPKASTDKPQVEDDRLPTGTERGVARKLIRRQRSTPGPHHATLVSDDESSDDESSDHDDHAINTAVQHHQDLHARIEMDTMIDVDDMEHDWIDPLYSTSSARRSPKSRRPRKRQPRISEVFHLSKEEQSDANRHPDKSKQRSAHSQYNSTRRQPTASRLSVLDVQTSPASTSSLLPRFVRLAARQARRAPERSRQSPSNKHIRLATRDDTHDAVQTLWKWQNGGIPQAAPTIRGSKPVQQNVLHAATKPSIIADTISRPHQQVIESYFDGDVELENQDQERSPNTGGRRDQATMEIPRRSKPTRRTRTNEQRMRNAQLEDVEEEQSRVHRETAFDCRLRAIIASHASNAAARPTIRKGSRNTAQKEHHHRDQGRTIVPNDNAQASDVVRPSAPRRLRKRPPQRMDIQAHCINDEEESEPLTLTTTTHHQDNEPMIVNRSALHGFSLSHVAYQVDWHMKPLPHDYRVDPGSFLGSGAFADSISLADRQLNVPAQTIRIPIGTQACSWSAWNEEVKSGLHDIADLIENACSNVGGAESTGARMQHGEDVISSAEHLLKAVIRYVTYSLYFSDTIDRKDCVLALAGFARRLSLNYHNLISQQEPSSTLRTKALHAALVICSQSAKLAQHLSIPSTIRIEVQDKLRNIAETCCASIFTRSSELIIQYQQIHGASASFAVADGSALSDLLQLFHILQASTSGTTFWTIMDHVLSADVATTTSVLVFENIWQTTFTMLPALDFDAYGSISAQVRSQSRGPEAWHLLLSIQKRVLGLYADTSFTTRDAFNAYIRTMLMRAECLIKVWRWWKCEAWLASMYDFFANRGLSLLDKEHSDGAGSFLNRLSNGPDLSMNLQDSSYQLVLKLLASAFLEMRWQNVYTHKKIGSTIWRFIPNHARSYHKEAELRQTDLQALRNHYDLLCVLYYASPPGHRIRVQLFKDLIDHRTSHRAACKISIKAWTYLASFQISTDESVASLDLFIAWFNEMFSATLVQYKLARTEAEEDFHRARAQGGLTNVTNSDLEAIISRNQQVVASTLTDLALGMKDVVKNARARPVLEYFVEQCHFFSSFEDLDCADRQLKDFLSESVNAAQLIITFEPKRAVPKAYTQSEDSQDFGEFPTSQDLAAIEDEESATHSTSTTLFEPILALMSNLCGADDLINNGLMLQTIDVWVMVAGISVQSKQRSWSDIVCGYASCSWTQFRQTSHHRIFTPYFLARVVQAGATTDDNARDSIITFWLKSLVVRESMLKFQHDLTTALLNHCPSDPILFNLPFARPADTGTYAISMTLLRQRRLATISSLLSNMRSLVRDEMPAMTRSQKQIYSVMMREVMTAMKDNFQETQSTASGSVAGHADAYVEFVHQVISLMQQYTSNFCQVDRFFTENRAFPLPADDPTYLIGRLRSYGATIHTAQRQKELAAFTHTICERALFDNQQAYLVEQVRRAVWHDNDSITQPPYLVHVWLGAIVPAYLELFTSPYGQALLMVMLKITETVVKDIHYYLRFTTAEDLSALNNLSQALTCALQGCLTIVEQTDVSRPQVHGAVRIAVSILDTCKCMLLPVQLLAANSWSVDGLGQRLDEVYEKCKRQSRSPPDIFDLLDNPTDSLLPAEERRDWSDLRAFTARQIPEWVENNDGTLSVKRGNIWRKLPQIPEEGEHELTNCCQAYCEAYERVFTRRPYTMAVRNRSIVQDEQGHHIVI